MKKTTKLLSLCIIASFSVATALIGCKKNDMNTGSNVSHKTLAEVTPADPSNGNNPFDFVGADHNTAVIDYYNNYYDEYDAETQDPVAYLEDYFGYSSTDAASVGGAIIDCTNGILGGSGSYGTAIDNYLANNSDLATFTSDVKNVITDGTLTLQEQIDAIIALEDDAAMNLSGSDLDDCYKVASGARHSLYLWNSIDDGGAGGPYGSGTFALTHKQQGEVILSDAVGFWIGSISALWAGPAALGTAVIGAATNSVNTYMNL